MRPHRNTFGARVNRRGGCTLIELLAVVAIVAVLAAILLPRPRLCREHARRVVCGKHINQQYLGITTLAMDRNNSLTFAIPDYATNYACDLSLETARSLDRAGLGIEIFYCPANPAQKVYRDDIVDFAAEKMRHCGYWYLIGSAERDRAVGIKGPNKHWVKTLDDRGAATTELIVDQTFSEPDSDDTALFHTAHGAVSVPDQTNHMGNQFRPYGGNVCFLDGHIQWRPFRDMDIRLRTGQDCWW